jgi:hypothetical protein
MVCIFERDIAQSVLKQLCMQREPIQSDQECEIAVLVAVVQQSFSPTLFFVFPTLILILGTINDRFFYPIVICATSWIPNNLLVNHLFFGDSIEGDDFSLEAPTLCLWLMIGANQPFKPRTFDVRDGTESIHEQRHKIWPDRCA